MRTYIDFKSVHLLDTLKMWYTFIRKPLDIIPYNCVCERERVGKPRGALIVARVID